MNIAIKIEEIQTDEGLIPVCASCGKIRDRRGRWHGLDVLPCGVSREHLTHSLCPECTRLLYPSHGR